jgi:hypothetical protein
VTAPCGLKGIAHVTARRLQCICRHSAMFPCADFIRWSVLLTWLYTWDLHALTNIAIVSTCTSKQSNTADCVHVNRPSLSHCESANHIQLAVEHHLRHEIITFVKARIPMVMELLCVCTYIDLHAAAYMYRWRLTNFNEMPDEFAGLFETAKFTRNVDSCLSRSCMLQPITKVRSSPISH